MQLFPLSLLLSAASALSIRQAFHKTLFLNQPEQDHAVNDASSFHFPTVRESTVMARRILHLASLGTLVTVFPADSSSSSIDINGNDNAATLESRPAGMAGTPIGLMEYIADCASPDDTYGNPTMLAISIATPFKNYHQGSNISLSVRWWPDQKHTYSSYEIPTPHTPAALPRFSLIGHLEAVDLSSLEGRKTQACFLKKHPDSFLWQPGNDIHESGYVRFVVEQVYWFGGFGDRARIGWLPIEDWRNITMEEVEKMRLPGEEKQKKSWRDWL